MHRIKDPGAIEARLLELAHTTDAKLTAPALAYFAPCSIEQAIQVLDRLAAHGQLSMEIEDDGTVVYQMFGRQKLGLPAPAPSTALVPITPIHHGASPLVAGVLTLWLPGAGHLYAGQVVSAVLWFLAVGAGYLLIFPGLVLHLLCIASAVSAARHSDPPRRMLAAGG